MLIIGGARQIGKTFIIRYVGQPGNISCWLENGDGSKAGYQTAQRMIAYMMQY